MMLPAADWRPHVISIVEGVFAEARANLQLDPKDSAERLLTRLYSCGYAVLLIDEEVTHDVRR